jgi:hypothetical protein
MAAGYENCNDADFLRIDSVLGLAIGKGDEAQASQSRLSGLMTIQHKAIAPNVIAELSLSRVTLPCTKFAQNRHEISSSLSSQLHEQMSCWTQRGKAMHCGLNPDTEVLPPLWRSLEWRVIRKGH